LYQRTGDWPTSLRYSRKDQSQTHPIIAQPEVGKVTLKNNGDEFPLKSNGDEALNNVFPQKVTAKKRLTLRKNCSDEVVKRLTLLKN
jgi:hypothetical protein